MYRRDVTEIKDECRRTNSILGVAGFAIASIQAGLSTVVPSANKVTEKGLYAISMTHKRHGIKYIIENDDYLYPKSMHIADKYGYNDVEGITEAILLFMKIPMVGMVKAGFICQMLGFDVACLDSHNLKRLGISEAQMKIDKNLSEDAKRSRIQPYVELCQKEGAEFWWNTWCIHVAGNRANRTLDTEDVVSKFHVDCVKAWHQACTSV